MRLDAFRLFRIHWPSRQGGHRGQPGPRSSVPQGPRPRTGESCGHHSELSARLRLLLDLPSIAEHQGRESPNHPTPHSILGGPHADQGQQPEHDPGPHLRFVCDVSLDGSRRPPSRQSGVGYYPATRSTVETSRGGGAGTDGPDMGGGGLGQTQGGPPGQGCSAPDVASRGATERGPHGRMGVYRPNQESLGYSAWEGRPDPMGAVASPGHEASVDLVGEPGQAQVGAGICNSARHPNQQPSLIQKDQAHLPGGRGAPCQPALVPAYLRHEARRDRHWGQPGRPPENEAYPGAPLHHHHREIPPRRGAGSLHCGPRLRPGGFRERRSFDTPVRQTPKGVGFGSFPPVSLPTTNKTISLIHTWGVLRAHLHGER